MIALAIALSITTAPSCPNPSGYDAARDLVICERPPAPASTKDIASLKAERAKDVRAEAYADYARFCGLRSARWSVRVGGSAQNRIASDYRYRQASHSQQQDVLRWRSQVRKATLDLLGRQGESCEMLIGMPFMIQLDRMAYAGR